jgi:hypothetical protein
MYEFIQDNCAIYILCAPIMHVVLVLTLLDCTGSATRSSDVNKRTTCWCDHPGGLENCIPESLHFWRRCQSYTTNVLCKTYPFKSMQNYHSPHDSTNGCATVVAQYVKGKSPEAHQFWQHRHSHRHFNYFVDFSRSVLVR